MSEDAPTLEWTDLETRLGAEVRSGASAPRVWRVRRDGFVPLLDALAGEPAWAPWRLVDLTAVDRSGAGEGPEAGLVVLYWLEPARGETCLRLEVALDGHEALPSSAARWPVARWLEREVRDLFGLDFEGAPDRRPLLLAAGPDAPPLRRSKPPAEGTR